MNLPWPPSPAPLVPGRSAGSVLIIVLWVTFGLVSMALYFAHSMGFQLRAADNRVASAEADQAIAGALRYVSNILATAPYPGTLPEPELYRREAVAVGDATFWLIGRRDVPGLETQPFFNLVDESSKMNLNTASLDMLQYLPRMTPFIAAAVVDWRDEDSDASEGGAEDEIYQRLTPAYRCKNANYETVEELRLIYGMDLELLYGEDANLNGVLDLNENDGDQSFPLDNRDGRLDPGLLEYLTVYSKEPTIRTNGSPRVNVTSAQDLSSLLAEKFDTDRVNQILRQAGLSSSGGGGGGGRGGTQRTPTFGSVLEFYVRSGMTAAEFAEIETDITVSTNAATGLVNVNTASEMVLSCIPGIGLENAPAMVAYRQNNRATLTVNPTVTWVADVLSQTNALTAGRYLTGHSYQFTADIAAVGHFGRGYRRVKCIFDTSEGLPRVIFRQDLSHLGWALGKDVRNTLLTAAKNK